jgi:hypothetical protein
MHLIVEKLMDGYNLKIESEIKVCVYPRKWYIPKWLYNKIIKDISNKNQLNLF